MKSMNLALARAVRDRQVFPPAPAASGPQGHWTQPYHWTYALFLEGNKVRLDAALGNMN